MHAHDDTKAILRHQSNSPHGQTGVTPEQAKLPQNQIVTIGREPSCHIVIDSVAYAMVSRRHADIRYESANTASANPQWWICDRNSANGTYINQQKLQGCHLLKHGDQIMLGQDGPSFVFELIGTGQSISRVPASFKPVASRAPSHPPINSSRSDVAPSVNVPSPNAELPLSTSAVDPLPMASAPAPRPKRDSDITITQLFPILSSGLDLRRKAYLLPGAIAVTFVVALFMTIEVPQMFNFLLASFLAIGCYYVIYQLCGKEKPAALLLGTALMTVLLLRSPILPVFIWVFREVLPGAVATNSGDSGAVISFPAHLVRMFFGAGLMEELFKALPLFVIIGFSQSLKASQQNRWGIIEPLDGILLGAASAIGFTLSETLGQYVPDIIQGTQLQAGVALSQLRGLQLLIPRLLGAISGHVAYSGYFGYFIGLSVLRPKYRWRIFLVGYITASALHALWNAMGGVSPVLLAIVGMLSYAFLATSIVKARALSPNRHKNFATRLTQD